MSQPNTETALDFLSDAQASMNDKLETLRALLETGHTSNVEAIMETLTQFEQEVAWVVHPTDGLAYLLSVPPQLSA
jgi:hypothetical protein